MPLPPSAVPLADDGESGLIRQLVFLPDGKRVATISADAADGVYRARVYDANTGALQRTLSGPGESTNDGQWCIAALGGEVVATGCAIHDTAGSLNFALSFWHAITGRRLHLSIQASPIREIAVLDSSRFVTGAHDGALAFHRHRGGEDAVVLQSFPNVMFNPKKICGHLDTGNRIAAHGGKMVCVSDDRTVQVWDVDRREVCGTLSGHAESVTGVALGSEHIVTTTDDVSGLNMYIWDAANASPLHRVSIEGQFLPLFPTIFADSLVLTFSRLGEQVWTELATGVSAYRVEMDIKVSAAAMAPDCRIALGYVGLKGDGSWTGAIMQAPPSLADIAPASPALAVADESKPIKEMFVKLCAGDIRADEAVAKVINADSCGANLSEFLHAHHLALVAVKRGGVPGTTNFSVTEGSTETEGGATVTTTRTFGGPNWWFLNLYCSARKLQLSEVALRMVQSCLAEAADAGLIEGTEGVLGTIVARDDLRQGMEVMQSGAIRICRMFADLQDKLSNLESGHSELEDKCSTLLNGQAEIERELVVKEKQLEAIAVAFRRFQRNQAVAHLVGFGLQLIPFAGGSLAEAVSGAAAVGDLAKDLLGAGVGMIGESQNLIADRIFVRAGKCVENLGTRSKAEAQLVAKLGISGGSELQQLFVQGRANVCNLTGSGLAVEFELIVQEFSGILAVAKEEQSDMERAIHIMDGHSLVDACDSDCRRADGDSAIVGNSSGERRSDDDSGAGSSLIAGMPDFAALKLTRREIGVADLEKMLDWELVQLIAGDLVSFNPGHADRFESIRTSLTTALEMLDICAGDDLVGEHSFVDRETFVRVVLEQLERDGLVAAATETRLNRLMSSVSED